MSPQNKKKLNSLRKQLDKLDNDLLKIIKKRTSIVKQVLSTKEYKYEIVDKKRINKVLSNIRNKSLKNNIDPKITNRIWKNMIWSYIDFEKKNFKEK
jgi:chorismate mutase|tara:strand:- start:1293 stop:1583 length:291 start_codon:yes stop_codon:yes gene_type:complete